MCPHSYGVTPNKRETELGSSLSRDNPSCDRSNASNMLPFNEILALSGQKKSGLILCKRFHAEFVGPGGAIGTPQTEGYNALITICLPGLVKVNSYQERQRAYRIRIQWMRWQKQITNSSKNPIVRLEKLLSCFEEFFGWEAIAQLPSYILAQLIGALPQTVERFRQQNHLVTGDWGSMVTCWETLSLDSVAVNEAISFNDFNCQSCVPKCV